MSKRAPTSTPCVGSSASITLTSPRRNGRMSDTFCWLPPESDDTGCSDDAMRTRRRSTSPAIARRSRPRRTTPARASRRSTWMVAFARTLKTGNRASPRRSPLSRTTPARSGPAGERVSSLAPSHDALPTAGSMPASARRNGTWPLPSAPAIPRISPFRTTRSTGPKRSPRSPDTASTTSACSARSRRSGYATVSGRPIISATSSSSETDGASKVPCPTPSRSTVTRSATASTSGRRWLT